MPSYGQLSIFDEPVKIVQKMSTLDLLTRVRLTLKKYAPFSERELLDLINEARRRNCGFVAETGKFDSTRVERLVPFGTFVILRGELFQDNTRINIKALKEDQIVWSINESRRRHERQVEQSVNVSIRDAVSTPSC